MRCFLSLPLGVGLVCVFGNFHLFFFRNVSFRILQRSTVIFVSILSTQTLFYFSAIFYSKFNSILTKVYDHGV